MVAAARGWRRALRIGVLVPGLALAIAGFAQDVRDAQDVQRTWRGLTVAPEHRCAHYDSRDYRYAPALEARIAALLGRVFSPYTGRCFASMRETDIEHIVARSEAHDSGLCRADAETRRRFAADLLNLTLASPGVNRHRKRDHDAADWLPEKNRCWFAARIVEVRRKYGLSIDAREAAALEQVLGGCQSTALAAADCTAMQAPAEIAAADADGER